jgi:malate dehydrogenase (oxaloacetate-decarboxylating)(NADP+)
VGIADLIASAMVDAGLSLQDARLRCWLVDSKGLVVESRTDLAHHKLRYAHAGPGAPDFISAIRALEPTAIIGVSTVRGSFTREAVELMTSFNERPIVFALSNPTSQSECTAEEAYTWSGGRAIFASGSPFSSVTYNGQTFEPGQCNNVYIFPGVALGVIATGARLVTDRMFSEAARALANQVAPRDLAVGRLFPALTSIRDVSAHVAHAVAELVYGDNLATVERPEDVLAMVRSAMWHPEYPNYAV